MAKVLKNVVIVPVRSLELVDGIQQVAKKRVAAYCRVSTDSEEQLNSYEAQVTYYGKLIHEKAEWEYVDVYADEGTTGTNTKHRLEFHRMITDALAGKMDMIITKSISRFARNTEDCLRFVRQLKNKGVAVYFEKENINTLDSAGEVLLTILSSLAQDESRNISENSKWGIVRKFQEGKVVCNTTRFLGYDKDEFKELVINGEEAVIVRRIFQEYIEGKSYQSIAKGLMNDEIETVTGNKKWWDSSITLILTNEKYYGALLQQKTVTLDFLTHKRVKNKGQEKKYLIEDNHEPIISKEMFELVQNEKERRALLKGNLVGDRNKYSSKYAFSGKVFCGCCDANFKRRTWNSNNISKKVVWQCKTYVNEGKAACDAKAVDEYVLQEAFVRIFNRLKEDKSNFIQTMNANIEKVLSKRESHEPLQEIEKRIDHLKEELKGLIKLKLRGNMDEMVYNEENERITHELDGHRKRKLELEKEEGRKGQYKERVQEIIQVINEQQGLLKKFDDDIFNALVEKIVLLSPTHFCFILKSGLRMDEVL
jgi:site-specific DNA recombinase